MYVKTNIMIILLTISFNTYGLGQREENNIQKSDSFSYEKTGDTFKLIRDSKDATDIIAIYYSNADNNYYVTNKIKKVTIKTDEEILLNSTNTNILGINSFTFTGDYHQFIHNNNILVYNSSNQTTEDLITLVSHDPNKKSYQFVLNIKPSINIDNINLENNDNFVDVLKENPNIRMYLKKQLLGTSLFKTEADKQFPLFNIDNGYIIEVEPVYNENRFETIRNVISEGYNFFDQIYDYDVNNSEYEKSLISKLFKVYYDKNKPVYQHYMNKASLNNFDYTLYDKLTKDEGQEFVDKALTYLTWGLEYSLHGNNDGNIPFKHEDNNYPSQILNDKNELKDWCIKNIPNNINNRNNNYLPYEPVEIYNVVNENDITYLKSQIDDLDKLVNNIPDLNITTPFLYTENSENKNITGSSLPYVKGGIDSPRTFNYKMLQQYEIIKSKAGGYYNYNGSTNNYLYSLNDETLDVNSEDYYYFKGVNPDEINPFYPGYDFNNNDGYVGTNLTGVDIFGLISGALSMTTFSNDFRTINNNSEKLDLLDGYFRMYEANYNPNINQNILNEQGLPFFSSNPTKDLSSILLTREDIERVSVIIPELNLIQAGDLLVGTIDGKDEIVIVVDPGNNNEAKNFDISEVLVLSVTENDRRVSLNYWGEGSGILKAFTLNPKDFIPRRLIKYNDKLKSTYNEKDEEWDPMLFIPQTLVAILDTNVTDPNNYGNCIGNTGEFFNINSIMFQNEDNLNYIEEDNLNIKLEPPIDINYNTTEADNNNSSTGNNILVNKGDGFEFYAHFIKSVGLTTTNEYIKLATFNLNTSSNSKENRYTVSYNPDIFDEIGNTKDNFKLKYYSDFGIEFKIEEVNSSIRTNQFAIRPLKENIRPGDDIGLRFSFMSEDNISIATANIDSHLAVYDKKMLWRANLYIDNNDENDWNNKHPWNSPSSGIIKGTFNDFYKEHSTITNIMKLNNNNLEIDYDKFIWYGNNEWNKEYKGDNRLSLSNFEPNESEYLNESELINSDGRQTITFRPYTYNPHIVGGNRQKKEINVVAYAYGCADSPFEFNDELVQQQLVMSKYYNDIGIKFKKPKTLWGDLEFETNIDMFTPYQYNLYVEDYDVSNGDDFKNDRKHISLLGWDSTTSPKPWINNEENIYIKPSVHLGTSEVEYRVPREVSNMSGSENFPFVPGYSLWYFLEHNSCPDWLNVISAGVDCNGFVSRSASYDNNQYLWEDATNQNVKEYDSNTNDKWFTNPSYPYWKQVGNHEIASDRITDKNNKNEFDEIILQNVIPGDIMYLQNITGLGNHITLVSEVNLSNEMTLSDIKLIESTWENEKNWAKVVNVRSLKDYEIKNWVIVRPR